MGVLINMLVAYTLNTDLIDLLFGDYFFWLSHFLIEQLNSLVLSIEVPLKVNFLLMEFQGFFPQMILSGF